MGRRPATPLALVRQAGAATFPGPVCPTESARLACRPWRPLPAAALKLVGESFPWSPASAFVHLRDNHNSVLGIRQLAAQHGAACTAAVQLRAARRGAGGCWWQLAPCSAAAAAGLQAAAAAAAAEGTSGASSAEHLFAFPMESNFSGARYDPGLVAAVQSGCLRYSSTAGDGTAPVAAPGSTGERCCTPPAAAGSAGEGEGMLLPPGRWRVLLDCAKAAATSPPDLAACPADFVALSYYKIFGYPTGEWRQGMGREDWAPCTDGRHWRLRFVNIGETAPPATPHLQSSALVWPCDRPTLPLPAGLGALIARREALGCLQRRYFGGGTVAVSLADEPFHRCAPSLPLF